MDISVPSNFERLLFEVSGRDGDQVRRTYDQYKQAGTADLPDSVRGPLGCTGFSSAIVSNAQTLREMRVFKEETGELICPHTAVGTAVARDLPATDACTVILATAHAAKFPETVHEATSDDAPLPQRCQALHDKGEVYEQIANDISSVKDLIRANMIAET